MNKLLLTAALSLALSSVFAADPLTDAAQKAYAPYRAALFKTNSGSQAEAQQALQQAQQSWQQLSSRFASQPPAPYDRDPALAQTLQAVSQVYDKAATEVGKNELTQAHESLEQIRDLLADLRHRNQVIVYSDHMNAYHAEMEHVLNNSEKMLGESNGLLQLTAQAGVLSYLSSKLASEAPAEYRSIPEFQSLLQAQQQSVSDLQAALFAQNADAVKAAIGKLKVPYSKLFVKFG